jgi:hypothetical protein
MQLERDASDATEKEFLLMQLERDSSDAIGKRCF